MKKIEGIVNSILYESNDSMYKVLKVSTKDNDDLAVVGNFPVVYVLLKYEFEGEFVNHDKFGMQFKSSSYTRLNYLSKEGVISFLSSEKFKGIGPKTAGKIYELYGSDCIDKIIKNKDLLKDVGINESKQESIYEALVDSRVYEEIFIELYDYGLTYNMISRLYEKYENLTLSKVKENPYRLIYEVDGFGFLKSDTLALNLGFSYDNEIRINEAILYTLNYVCNSNGHVFLTKEQTINTTYNLLNKKEEKVNSDNIIKSLDNLITNSRIIIEENRVYLKKLYNDELNLSSNLLNFIDEKTNNKYDKEKIIKFINEVQNNYDIIYTDDQKMAILNSLINNISIITGGPGSGKTTIIKAILNVFASLNNKNILDDDFAKTVILCAPTGRASKRMQESCGLKAQTIHKTLGYKQNNTFEFNKENKLACNLIIIDESSMIDQSLASNLFDAISITTKVIIVGDKDQLPSIGAGNVLNDLMLSNKIHVSSLNVIMRQAENSDIIKFSHGIKNQNIDFSIFNNKKDVFYYDSTSSDVIRGIDLLINRYIKSNGDFINDLQILVPMYAGVCGIDAINSYIQDKFNKNTLKIVRGKKIFKVNDKVLQLQNDVMLNIMNGDIGIIKDINNDVSEPFLTIDFDGLMVKYEASNLDNLTLAYAISIHKSQGSEYKNVILPVVSSYSIMLKKKLIYTAVTRAKEKLIVIGKYNTLLSGVNNFEEIRQTSLVRRLNNIVIDKFRIYDKDIPFDYLGEENMENITPYSFM